MLMYMEDTTFWATLALRCFYFCLEIRENQEDQEVSVEDLHQILWHVRNEQPCLY